MRSSSGGYENGKKEGNTNRFQSMALTRDDVGWEMNGSREKIELTGNQDLERKETKENVSREERMTMSDWWGEEWQKRGDDGYLNWKSSEKSWMAFQFASINTSNSLRILERERERKKE